MELGNYKVKDHMIDDFNSRFSNYGDDLKDFIFDFKSKKEVWNEMSYRIEFYNTKSTFKDSITKSVPVEKVSWFENYFIKI